MERSRRWVRHAFLATAAFALGPSVARTGDDGWSVRLVFSFERLAVQQTLAEAARRLDQPECQALLDEFANASGQPLRSVLQETRLSAAEYLDAIFFYDAPPGLCGTSALAVTIPGSHVVFVCGARFVAQTRRNSRYAEAVLIHEALHSLGLGENPPSSDSITERVRARCG